jgi:hypothetical protein
VERGHDAHVANRMHCHRNSDYGDSGDHGDSALNRSLG